MKLEIRNVTKRFKQKTAVSEFSMELETGQCVGLIGPNGAGKSTLIKTIADVLHADEGEVLLDGQRISNMKREIGYLPQYPNFFPWMTANETLLFMGQLSGMSKQKLLAKVPVVLGKVGLTGEENAKVQTFSGGMRQRLGIAQAILHAPAFIVMDEPVSALDPIGRREVLNLIQEIKKETTILLSTHILSDAEEICERFVIMKNGKKIEDTTITELLRRNTRVSVSMEIAPKDLQWIQLAGELPYVKKIEVKGSKVEFTLENPQQQKNMLLKTALNHDVDIVRFEAGGRETLEEIFLNLVVGV
ncbi:ATP-binding cassette domain-containing protein [Mesobacillus zeae]|uniref:ABC transporter ATP-binding protein n=1 Tax=Mesobacillus zeae TaxID=1917180 RepID=A0A398B248_9BACI|nr:ABC transporter ATP-binding protein [Mesobacillus zeae]RID81953.1 ABC transporter ATP-binding protein [Mesobacillus zeae]